MRSREHSGQRAFSGMPAYASHSSRQIGHSCMTGDAGSFVFEAAFAVPARGGAAATAWPTTASSSNGPAGVLAMLAMWESFFRQSLIRVGLGCCSSAVVPFRRGWPRKPETGLVGPPFTKGERKGTGSGKKVSGAGNSANPTESRSRSNQTPGDSHSRAWKERFSTSDRELFEY